LFEVRPYIGYLHKYKLVQTKQTGTYYKQTIHMIQCPISFGGLLYYIHCDSQTFKEARECSLATNNYSSVAFQSSKKGQKLQPGLYIVLFFNGPFLYFVYWL